MAKGKKTGGRKAGTPNKVSSTVKQNVIKVFDEIGGVEAMATWAKDNPTQFYNLYGKAMPKEMEHDVGETIQDRLLEKYRYGMPEDTDHT